MLLQREFRSGTPLKGHTMATTQDDAPSTELEATHAAEVPMAESPTTETPVAEAPVAATTEAAPVATAKPRNKKKLALIISAAVVAAALLFGGGVAVGTIIPTGGPGMSQGGPGGGGFPGGDQGDRPTMPGQGTQQDGSQTEDN